MTVRRPSRATKRTITRLSAGARATAVTGEATYTAQFRTVDKLLVRFLNGDGSVMKSEYVSVGGTLSLRPKPDKGKYGAVRFCFLGMG
ncbi:MAG: hypothetical protein ACLUSP_06510 [Christensenellales bacterium]